MFFFLFLVWIFLHFLCADGCMRGAQSAFLSLFIHVVCGVGIGWQVTGRKKRDDTEPVSSYLVSGSAYIFYL